jgi:predicted AAA+ superfamily ATPase
LFPLIAKEYGANFGLDDALSWGSLPIISQLTGPEERFEFLTSYVRLYLSEEIQKEQVVRNLEPFRHFLELAAQYNGKIINHSSLAKSIGVDPKTVSSYYKVLEDTLLGSFLLPFSRSFRKKLIKSPKFFLFDLGVTRAMARQLTVPLVSSTSYYGEVFEHFIFNEMRALFSYQRNDFRLSYYHDENNIEVNFVIERPGKPLLFVEVKSAEVANESMTKCLRIVARDFADAEMQLWSRDPVAKRYGQVTCMPWDMGLARLVRAD